MNGVPNDTRFYTALCAPAEVIGKIKNQLPSTYSNTNGGLVASAGRAIL